MLVFWDAHCEAIRHWAEPLLQRIKESPKTILLPVIDIIEFDDLSYTGFTAGELKITGFDWSGYFYWIPIPPIEIERRKKECPNNRDAICPARSPTMAGGIFAVERTFFFDIGAYDEGMYGWGGENLEISFRVWMCGGSLETIPCSRVGHIYRNLHTYRFIYLRLRLSIHSLIF